LSPAITNHIHTHTHPFSFILFLSKFFQRIQRETSNQSGGIISNPKEKTQIISFNYLKYDLCSIIKMSVGTAFKSDANSVFYSQNLQLLKASLSKNRTVKFNASFI
jgi:hypothetical protein